MTRHQSYLCKWTGFITRLRFTLHCKTLHIPITFRQHDSASGWWWAETVGSLPGRRFHDSQPSKVMHFSANSMKSGLNFAYKLDNNCLRSINTMFLGMHSTHLAEKYHVIFWLKFCNGANRNLENYTPPDFFSLFLTWLWKWWLLILDFSQTPQAI